jgi:hypothetical protein
MFTYRNEYYLPLRLLAQGKGGDRSHYGLWSEVHPNWIVSSLSQLISSWLLIVRKFSVHTIKTGERERGKCRKLARIIGYRRPMHEK